MGMTFAYINKLISREEFYKDYFSYVILTKRLKKQIFQLEKMDKYATTFREKEFLLIFVSIPEINKIVDEREKAYIKLKDSYEKIMNSMDEASRISSKCKEYYHFINEERDIEYKNAFLDLLNTIADDLSKVYVNIEDAKNILLNNNFR